MYAKKKNPFARLHELTFTNPFQNIFIYILVEIPLHNHVAVHLELAEIKTHTTSDIHETFSH